MRRRLPLLLVCAATAIVAYLCLDYYDDRNSPLYKRLERQWADDVEQLEASKKLPGAWFDVGEIELVGGTPETKDWLARIHVPLKMVKDGHYKLEVLVVAWEEEGKRGSLVQYNLADRKTGNNIWELGRTFIHSVPRDKDPFKAFLQDLNL